MRFPQLWLALRIDEPDKALQERQSLVLVHQGSGQSTIDWAVHESPAQCH